VNKRGISRQCPLKKNYEVPIAKKLSKEFAVLREFYPKTLLIDGLKKFVGYFSKPM